MPNVGLSIIEGVANGASAFKEPSKRNIGLLGQFVRGAGFTPTKITSEEEFNTIFGGQNSAYYGPMTVKSIFREAGNAPVTLYIARVVNDQFVAATKTVSLGSSGTPPTMKVTAGYKGVDDPGAWGNKISVSLYSLGSRVKGMYTLVVSYNGQTETYSYATLAEIQSAVNRVSKYITIEFSKELGAPTYTALSGTVVASMDSSEITGTSTTFTTELAVGVVLFNADHSAQIGTVAQIIDDTHLILTGRAMATVNSAVIAKRVDVVYTAVPEGGADGTVTENDFYPIQNVDNPKGLACFDGYDVQILACTEYHSLTMAQKLNEYLANWKNPIGVVNLPMDADEGTAELYANALQTGDKSFIAGYMGWGKVPDENGDSMLIPLLGPILGAAYLRTPYIQGDYIHIPPAGTDSLFNYVTEVLPARLSQNSINKIVQQFTTNIIQYVDNLGYYVGSSRLYSTNPLYMSIHIRLQTSYYLRYLYASMRFTEQKPNTPELKREALTALRQFFQNEYNNGALERSVPFNTAYQGICDTSNNPPSQDRKLLNIDVLWIPTECTESVQISLQRNDGILTVMESEA